VPAKAETKPEPKPKSPARPVAQQYRVSPEEREQGLARFKCIYEYSGGRTVKYVLAGSEEDAEEYMTEVQAGWTGVKQKITQLPD
jgi:hypothetical protein